MKIDVICYDFMHLQSVLSGDLQWGDIRPSLYPATKQSQCCCSFTPCLHWSASHWRTYYSCIHVTPVLTIDCAYYRMRTNVCLSRGSHWGLSAARKKLSIICLRCEQHSHYFIKNFSIALWWLLHVCSGRDKPVHFWSCSQQELLALSLYLHHLYWSESSLNFTFMWFKLFYCRVAPKLSQTQPTQPPSWT